MNAIPSHTPNTPPSRLSSQTCPSSPFNSPSSTASSASSECAFYLDWNSDSSAAESESDLLSSTSSCNSPTSLPSHRPILIPEKPISLPQSMAPLQHHTPTSNHPSTHHSTDAIVPQLSSTSSSALKPRLYQLEILKRAQNKNVIAILDTGSGKTLVAALLIRDILNSLYPSCTSDQPPSLTPPIPSQHIPSSTLSHSTTALENADASKQPLQPPPDPSTLKLQPTKSYSKSQAPLSTPHLEKHHNPSLPHGEPLQSSPSLQQQPSTSKPNVARNSPQPINSLFSLSEHSPQSDKKHVVFLVHRVALVPQQANVIRSVLPPEHEVAVFYGEKTGDDFSSSDWIRKLRSKKVLVMTAQILLNLLRHGILQMSNFALLVIDEVHHATKNHPYCRIFVEFYHSIPHGQTRPRVFGMTATPVKSKAASTAELPCLQAICALEATLDATIVTLSDDYIEEFRDTVPTPDEFVITFKGTGIDNDSEALNDFDLETRVLSKMSNYEIDFDHPADFNYTTVDAASDAPNQSPDVVMHGSLQADEMKIVLRVFRQIGFKAAFEFAKHLCRSSNLDPAKSAKQLLDECSKLEIESGGVPEKVSKLLDLLFSEYIRCEKDNKSCTEAPTMDNSFRCIVFLKERSCALALTWLINMVFEGLNIKALRAKWVVGSQNTESSVRMSRSKLLQRIEEFRNGEFGILIATSVVEEGIDVPACRLVVSFDFAGSATGYIQARGRARKRNARYIALVEEGNAECYNSFLNARQGANLMNQVAKDQQISEDDKNLLRSAFLAENTTETAVLQSRSTHARIGPTEAVDLLQRYCTAKSEQWRVEEPIPLYIVTENEFGFIATVTINEQAEIDRGLCIKPQRTKLQARRHAALSAYRKLYEIGEVDAYLLPRRPCRSERVLRVNMCGPIPKMMKSQDLEVRPSENGQRRRREVQSKASKKHKRVRRCKVVHPKVLQLEQSKVVEQLKADVTENSDGQKLEPSEKKKVPSEKKTRAAPVNVPQFMHMYIIKLDCDMSQKKWYKAEKAPVFSLLLREKLPSKDWTAVRCPVGTSLLSLRFEKTIQWSDKLQEKGYKYVKCLKTCLRGHTPGSRITDVNDVEASRETTAAFLLMPVAKSKNENEYRIDWEAIDQLLCYGWKVGPRPRDETCDPKLLENSLVCSYHEELYRVYVTTRIQDNVRADSRVSGYINSSGYRSFANYFAKKHNLELQDSKQKMLAGFQIRTSIGGNLNSPFMLAPETCRIIPISPLACFITSLLPAWQTFLALRACWRRNTIEDRPADFLSFAKALQPNISNVTRGIADLSYERLEFLGDAVLKIMFSMVTFVQNPEDSEGILSDERDLEVSNQRLADLALEMKVHDCVAFSGVSQNVKSWPWFWAADQGDPIQVSEKVLADCVEALIGVHFLHGGIELATAFVDKHKLMPGASQVLGFGKGSSAHELQLPVPSMQIEDKRHEDQVLQEVEQILNYQFKDKRHLVVALTHGSYKNGTCCTYQRYEYLGDAAVGFILLSYFFNEYPSFSPGELTTLKGPALSNDLFARAIISKGIHKKFWYDCSPLKREIEKFEQLIVNEDEEEDVSKIMTVPKTLGDLLESIIGAVLVDKGMRLDGMQEIVLRLVDDELRRFANPEKFKTNPICMLVRLIQKTCRTKGPRYEYEDDAQSVVKICIVYLDDEAIGRGVGPTRRIARRKASIAALEALKADESFQEKSGTSRSASGVMKVPHATDASGESVKVKTKQVDEDESGGCSEVKASVLTGEANASSEAAASQPQSVDDVNVRCEVKAYN